MDCHDCEYYRHGAGTKSCLKCKKYMEVQKQSIRRQTIRTEHLPQAILDNVADPRTRDLMDIIRQIPTQYAVPLMMRSILDMTLPEIADYHGVSKQAVHQKIKLAIDIIDKSMLDG